MNNINNVLWYSIGAFDALLDREMHKGTNSLFKNYTTDRESILSDDEIKTIENVISSFNYSEEELSEKRIIIADNLKSRPIIKDYTEINKRQTNFIFKKYKKGGTAALDAILLSISKSIEDESVYKNTAQLNKIIKEISSLNYLYLIDELSTSKVFYYITNANILLNELIDFDEDLLYQVDDTKFNFYLTIRNSMVEMNRDENNRSQILNGIKDFEILDLFNIFNWNNQVLSQSLIDYLLVELEKDNKKEAWPVNRYNCLKMFLLETKNPLDSEYFYNYTNYFVLDKSNAQIIMALRAQYNEDTVLSKKIINAMDIDNLNDYYLNYYYDLKEALKNSNKSNLRTIKNRDVLLKIVELGDRAKFNEYLDDFDTSSLSLYCLNECSKVLIDSNNYTVMEIEAVLYKTPVSLYSYLSKDCKYIKTEDIPSLYIFTIILLKLNLIKESHILLKRLIEKIDSTDKRVNEIFELQLLLTKKFLGYII